MSSVQSLAASHSQLLQGDGTETIFLDDAAGGSGRFRGEEFSDVPPLAIVSSRTKSSLSLVRLANPGVAVVHYRYEDTSLSKLLQLVGETLKGRRALGIALVVHGQPGSFKMCSAAPVSVFHSTKIHCLLSYSALLLLLLLLLFIACYTSSC